MCVLHLLSSLVFRLQLTTRRSLLRLTSMTISLPALPSDQRDVWRGVASTPSASSERESAGGKLSEAMVVVPSRNGRTGKHLRYITSLVKMYKKTPHLAKPGSRGRVAARKTRRETSETRDLQGLVDGWKGPRTRYVPRRRHCYPPISSALLLVVLYSCWLASCFHCCGCSWLKMSRCRLEQ